VDAEIPPAVAKELEAMKDRIAQLEAELKARNAQGQANPAATLVNADLKIAGTQAPASVSAATPAPATEPPTPEEQKPSGAMCDVRCAMCVVRCAICECRAVLTL